MTERIPRTPLRTPLTPVTPKSAFPDLCNRPRLITSIKGRLVLDENDEMSVEVQKEAEGFAGYAHQQGVDVSEIDRELQAEAARNRFEVFVWEEPLGLIAVERMTVGDFEHSAHTSGDEVEREVDEFVSANIEL